jgi:hypothetical protein
VVTWPVIKNAVVTVPGGKERQAEAYLTVILALAVWLWLFMFPEMQWAGLGGAKGAEGGPLTSQTRPPTRCIASSAQIWIHKN